MDTGEIRSMLHTYCRSMTVNSAYGGTAPSEADSTATSKKCAAPAATEQAGTCCRTPGYAYKSSWFPGVPTTLDGGVHLRLTHAHKIGKSRAMLFFNLDDGFSCNSSIIATADVAFNCFQFEARGPIASARHVSREVKSTTSIARAAHEAGRGL